MRAFAILFLADRLSKELVRIFIPEGQTVYLIGDFLSLTHLRNEGLIFGFLASNKLLILSFNIFALVLLILFYKNLPKFGFYFLLAGVCGNFTDRLLHKEVIDFIDIGIGKLRYPTFNFADVYILPGIILTFYYIIYSRKGAG